MGEETLAQRLRRLREARGLSQNGLAKLADVSPGQVYMIEAGKRRRMREATANRIARVLEVPQAYLEYGYEGPPADDAEWPAIEVWIRARADLRDEENIQQLLGMYRRLLELEQLRTWRAAIEAEDVSEDDLPEITLDETGELAAYDDVERAEQMRREAEGWTDEDPA